MLIGTATSNIMHETENEKMLDWKWLMVHETENDSLEHETENGSVVHETENS